MKKMMVMMLVILNAMNVFGMEVSDKLLDAVMMVESNGKADAKGDYSKGSKEYRAIGAYQLWKIYVDDVNRISSSSKFSYEDRYDKTKSREMVKIYLVYYGKRYERLTGKKANNEILSRIHNGGPNGYKKSATIKYWDKVKKEMSK